MKSILRALNILNWPMWVKLSAGFVFAILVPLAVILMVTRDGFNEIGTQNIQTYIDEQNQRQESTISSTLQSAQAAFDTLVVSDLRSSLIGSLVDRNQIATTLLRGEFQRLALLSPMFARIRLVDMAGTIVAQATAERILPSSVAEPEAPAFIQASTALVAGKNQSVTVIRTPLSIEITRAVFDRNDQAIGFLIGTLNIETTVLDNLAFNTGTTYGAYSYLVTPGEDPVILSTSDTQRAATTSARNSTAVQQALAGQRGGGMYAIGDQRDIQVIGRYTPIRNPVDPDIVLFALVTEARADAPLTQALDYFSSARIFPVAIGLVALMIILVILFNQLITPSLLNLRQAIQGVARGDFDQHVMAASRDDEIGAVGAAFVDMRVQVRNLLDDLEARVAARTRDIAATQEISRFAATQQNLQTLMDQVVQLIVEHFPNIYHAQIFLIDPDRLYAVLRASTGEPGKILLARGHRLAIGSISVIGQVIDQQQTMIARDTATSQVHRRNEFLPDTRAELAIPLRVGDNVIGALDVQSKYRNAFTEDEVKVLQTMADQVAVAIENARLYQETMRRLEDIDRANRMATLNTWQEYIYGQRQRSLSSEAGIPTGTDMSELRRRAIAQGRVVTGTPTENNTVPIAVPIQLRGQTLGAVEWELPVDDLNENKLQLAQELANRLAVSLDNARLFEESQRAAERERIVNAIAAKLTPQTEISEILQTAVREVGQALRAPQVRISLNRADEHMNGHNGSNGSNGNH